jgi:putative NADH-flavin reductase
MKLVVLGATGGTGLEIVGQAIARGHSVTAFVRNPAAMLRFRNRIAIVDGNLLSRADMELAISGHDAILSGFGPRVPVSETDKTLMRDFARTLTEAMDDTGVKRAVIVSVAFLFKDSIIPPAYIFGRLFFPRTVADASAMEKVFEGSRLDWTIVRPPRLTDKALTGKYRVREDHLPPFGFTISRADVAEFVLKAVEDPNTVRKIFGVCN